MPYSFIDRCLSCEASPESIDDYIDAWHRDESSSEPLIEKLGFTPDEYSIWLRNPNFIYSILFSRKRSLPLGQAVEMQMSSGNLAARAISDEEGQRVIQWIKDNC